MRGSGHVRLKHTHYRMVRMHTQQELTRDLCSQGYVGREDEGPRADEARLVKDWSRLEKEGGREGNKRQNQRERGAGSREGEEGPGWLEGKAQNDILEGRECWGSSAHSITNGDTGVHKTQHWNVVTQRK